MLWCNWLHMLCYNWRNILIKKWLRENSQLVCGLFFVFIYLSENAVSKGQKVFVKLILDYVD